MHTDFKDNREFEYFYKDVFPVLYRISTRIVNNTETAEDICQEAFIKLKEKAFSIKDTNQAKYWLIRVVKNICFNFLKRKGRERVAYEKVLNHPDKKGRSDEDQLLREESRIVLRKALLMLPDKLRSPLVLKEYGDLSYAEISDILHLSESNVKVRIFRARKKLGEIINQEDIHVS